MQVKRNLSPSLLFPFQWTAGGRRGGCGPRARPPAVPAPTPGPGGVPIPPPPMGALAAGGPPSRRRTASTSNALVRDRSLIRGAGS